MPYASYKRRRYSRRSSSRRFPKAVYYAAKALNTKYRQETARANWEKISPLLNYDANLPKVGNRTRTFDNYVTDLRYAGRGGYFGSGGSAIGGAIAGAFGANRRAGRKIGGFLGRAAGEMSGLGGYVASGNGEYGLSNSLVSGSNVSVPSMLGGDEIGSICVTHKEYLGNITGSGIFENSAFQLNPGLSQTFPWLSQIAQNYEEYSFNQLMFTYTSLLSDSTASGVIGSIIMTTNYNAGQPDFTNTSDMLNNIGTISARPIDGPIIHGIECDDSKNVLPSYFVRSGSVPDNQDIKTYDMGRFQIATEGMPNDGQLQGQLWVSYNIVLRKPKIYTAAGKGIQTDMYKYLTTSGINKEYICGKTLLASPLNSIGTTITCPDRLRLRITFPNTTVQGIFKITINWVTPKDNDGFPNEPKMSPEWIYSNLEVALPQFYARFCQGDTAGNSNQYQTGLYKADPYYGEYPTQIQLCNIVRLLGSFALPTYLEINFPNFAGDQDFSATDCEIVVEQINPQLVAPTLDNPATWISQTVTK